MMLWDNAAAAAGVVRGDGAVSCGGEHEHEHACGYICVCAVGGKETRSVMWFEGRFE